MEAYLETSSSKSNPSLFMACKAWKIMSNAKRVRGCFTVIGLCPMCQNGLKDVNHIFKECDVVEGLKGLLSSAIVQRNERLNFNDWFEINLKGKV